MAVVGLKSNTWLNDDGLEVRFNASIGEATKWGEENIPGTNTRKTSGTIDLADLTTTDTTIIADGVFIPKGALIEKLELITLTETAGTNANLNIGLIKEDRTTEYDFDGLLAAGDDMNSGTDLGKLYSYVVGTTDAGTKIGTVLTERCLLTASADTAAFTAGTIEVRIYWSRPLTGDLS
jgi:hypothetical protein